MELINNSSLVNEIEKQISEIKDVNDAFAAEIFVKDFAYRFCWSSNAIEGNTLSLDETISVIEYDEVRSGHTFSEYAEAKNLYNAITNQLLPLEKKDITEEWIIRTNDLIMGNSSNGYRKGPVYVGSKVEVIYYPPSFERVPELMKNFMSDVNRISFDLDKLLDDISLQHIIFERIHPFSDGNGRTGRMILNQQLINNGLLPVSIPKSSDYRQAFRRYERNGDISKMKHIICKAELSAINVMKEIIDLKEKPEKSVYFEPHKDKKKQKDKGFEI